MLPFKHCSAATEEWRMKTAREVFDGMIKVVYCNPKTLSFESMYRRIYDLCLHRHGAIVTTMMKLASRLCAHQPEFQRSLRCTMVKDICLYYEKAFAPPRKLPPCAEVFATSRAELEAWAMRVLSRRNFRELWIAYYLRPGGPYERRIGAEVRWQGKRSREDDDTPSKRAKRDNADESSVRDEGDE